MEKNKYQEYIDSIKKYMEWMEKNKRKPSPDAEDELEADIALDFQDIVNTYITPYKKLSKEKKVEFRKEYPEIIVIIKTISEYSQKNNQNSKQEIKNSNPKDSMPKTKSKHEGVTTKESIYLSNIKKVKQWMIEHKAIRPPKQRSTDDEEKRLANALNSVKQLVIKPYNELTDKEKIRYHSKHPEIDEILSIMKWIEENTQSIPYQKIMKIIEWMNHRKVIAAPSKYSVNNEEVKLAKSFEEIEKKVVKPYREQDSERIRKIYPDIDKIIDAFKWIEAHPTKVKEKEIKRITYIFEVTKRKKTKPELDYLGKLNEIYEWMIENHRTELPVKESQDSKERNLSSNLSFIISALVRPYFRLSDEKKTEYLVKHQDFFEVLDMLKKIQQLDCSEKKSRLFKTMEDVIRKSENLMEAKKLEQKYEEALTMKNNDKAQTENKKESYKL